MLDELRAVEERLKEAKNVSIFAIDQTLPQYVDAAAALNRLRQDMGDIGSQLQKIKSFTSSQENALDSMKSAEESRIGSYEFIHKIISLICEIQRLMQKLEVDIVDGEVDAACEAVVKADDKLKTVQKMVQTTSDPQLHNLVMQLADAFYHKLGNVECVIDRSFDSKFVIQPMSVKISETPEDTMSLDDLWYAYKSLGKLRWRLVVLGEGLLERVVEPMIESCISSSRKIVPKVSDSMWTWTELDASQEVEGLEQVVDLLESLFDFLRKPLGTDLEVLKMFGGVVWPVLCKRLTIGFPPPSTRVASRIGRFEAGVRVAGFIDIEEDTLSAYVRQRVNKIAQFRAMQTMKDHYGRLMGGVGSLIRLDAEWRKVEEDEVPLAPTIPSRRPVEGPSSIHGSVLHPPISVSEGVHKMVETIKSLLDNLDENVEICEIDLKLVRGMISVYVLATFNKLDGKLDASTGAVIFSDVEYLIWNLGVFTNARRKIPSMLHSLVNFSDELMWLRRIQKEAFVSATLGEARRKAETLIGSISLERLSLNANYSNVETTLAEASHYVKELSTEWIRVLGPQVFNESMAFIVGGLITSLIQIVLSAGPLSVDDCGALAQVLRSFITPLETLGQNCARMQDLSTGGGRPFPPLANRWASLAAILSVLETRDCEPAAFDKSRVNGNLDSHELECLLLMNPASRSNIEKIKNYLLA